MYYLIYTSRESEVMTKQSLGEIMAISQTNNARDGITGLLIYMSGRFIQLLEGEKQEVVDCFQRITEDSRHHSVTQLITGYYKNRLFENWSMALKSASLDEYLTITGMKSIEEIKELKLKDQDSHAALIFMKHYSNQILKHYQLELDAMQALGS